MIDVKDIRQIADHYSLDVEYSGLDIEDRYQALKQAIKTDRIKIENSKLCFILSEDAKFFRLKEKGDTANVAKFRRASGGERRILLNKSNKNPGDAFFKIISRMCDITEASIDSLPSFDVSVMEDIVNLFL